MSITAIIVACIALAVCGIVVVGVCLKNQLFLPVLFGLGAIVGAVVVLPAAMNERATHGESATLKFDHLRRQFITAPQTPPKGSSAKQIPASAKSPL